MHKLDLRISYIVASLFIILLSIINGLTLVHGPFSGTYGSDALYYYQTSLDFMEDKSSSNILAPAFIYYQSTILSFIPYSSHELFIIVNVIIYIFLIGRLRFSFEDLYGIKYSNYFLLFVFNGVIIWALLRGMKESLIFFTLSLVFIACTFEGRVSLFKRFLALMALLFFIYIHALIKPQGELFAIAVVLLALIMIRTGFIFIVLCTFLSLSLIAIFLSLFSDLFFLQSIIAHQQLSAIEQGIEIDNFTTFDYVLAPFRFILGPGPFKSFLQLVYGDLFVASTKFGDVLIFFGSVVWYFFLYRMFRIYILVFSYKVKFRYTFSECIFFSYMLLYLFSYSVSYFGTGDTRHRAILYFCALPLFFKLSSIMNIFNQKN